MSRVHTVFAPTPSIRDPASIRPALGLGAIALLTGFAGSWIPSYWGDEAASVLSATRPWASLATMLTHIDIVHGLYYGGLHLWVSVFGTSELATRAPSAVAAGVMVAGTVILTRYFAGARTAILAGVVCIVLPRATDFAMETRSYAFTAAVAVWLTVLLVHLVQTRVGRRGWVLYTLLAVGGMYLFLYFGLILAAHGLFVIARYRDHLLRWIGAAAAAVVVALPILIAGYRQRRQIAFLVDRGYATAHHVLVTQWFLSPFTAVICWALILLAAAAPVVVAHRRLAAGQRNRTNTLTVLALLWLVVPTAALLAGNALIGPMYNMRYLSFSTPAAAILIALGVRAVAHATAPAWRKHVTVAVTAIIIASCVPVYLSQRTPYAKDDGSDLRQVAEWLQANGTAGDAVIFDQSAKPHQNPRLAIDLYPDDFTGLRDVALSVPYPQAPSLWDQVQPNDTLGVALGTSSTVWAVELPHQGTPPDVSYVESLGYTIASQHVIHRATVYRLVR